MRALACVWCAEIPGLQVYLFRRISDDLWKNHMAGSGSFLEMLANWIDAGLVRYNGGKNTLTFWNGSRIWLCHCQHEKDRLKYQGAEIHVLMIDELTHFTEVIYRYLRGRCRIGGLRIPEKYSGAFPRVVCGSNPGGTGHTFVKRMWVDLAAPMAITTMPPHEGGFNRQYIPAKLTDNPTLAENDPEYELRLAGLGSPALVRAMLEGDWNIVAGGALDDVWNPEKLRIPRFQIPKAWRIDRSFDWGSAAPFSVGWWATANGEEVELFDGRIFCPPKGTLIRINEWYGTKEVGTNQGLFMGSPDVAKGILAREKQMLDEGWILTKPQAGPADNAIYAVEDKESDSIAKKMEKAGVAWTKSDKRPGSRINGLQLLRERLMATNTGEGPGIYFCENCTGSFATLPVLPRDEKNLEDVDSGAEDHIYDEVRYRVLDAKRQYAKEIITIQPK